MNQVQEMPRLVEPARLPDAIERLSGLFERMKLQRLSERRGAAERGGAADAAGAARLARPGDWQTYQNSPEKLAFTASRPEGLYEMVECGMNWRSLQADGAREGDTLRREVIRHRDVELRSGSGIAGCQTFVYQDDLPAFAGCSLRLTRLADANAASDPAPDAIVDETYRSLLFVKTAMTHPAENAAGA